MFRKFPLIAILFVAGFATAEAQVDTNAGIKTFELLPVFDYSTEPPKSRADRNVACIDLVRLVQKCDSSIGLLYGERSGINWDIFQIVGERTRMVRIGKHEFTDEFEIPEITPWAKLEPGDRRTISIDTSGSDGEHGRNADGTIADGPPVREGGANKPVSGQVSSTIKRADGTVIRDNYSPYMQIKKGHVYAVRTYDRDVDQYFLVRIDDLDRGEKVTVSVKRVEGPARKAEQ